MKVVDLQSFFPYQGRGFGSSYRCTKHAHCQEKFWYASGYPNIMRGLRKLVPDDFGCDTGIRNIFFFFDKYRFSSCSLLLL